MKRSRLSIWTIAALLALAGCSSANIRSAGYAASTAGDLNEGAGSLQVVDALPQPLGQGGDAGQVVRVGDLIKVDVFGVDELDTEVQVSANGDISLPLIGSVMAAGKTGAALSNEIEQRYGASYLQNPEVALTLQQTVTLDGEFNRAGSYPVSGSTTLVRAIASAGNFTAIGDPATVFVYRSVNGQDYVAQYNVESIRAGRQPDMRVYGGDVVVAFPSGMKVLGSTLRESLGLARSATGLTGLL
ncbi:polysaccharide export protein [Arsenicitalea aurantiaca]|uniref:Polysaccharide export protein n=1 Tax=Arsenicitalea aurantiaca TaxID=1783274 RepID=A0A433X7B0_9HYPH|nr:polysaccharide biosynthesis/export family protein [Arsenicitalea aurantiaca]RUT29981.1 polysaccharide export protein [Arsenicitalea aurantiaca]